MELEKHNGVQFKGKVAAEGPRIVLVDWEIIINNRIPTLQMHSNHFSVNGTSANIVTNTDTNTDTITDTNTC